MRDRSHDIVMAELLRADQSYAAELLTDVRLNGDSAELAILLRQMEMAFGQDEWNLASAAGCLRLT
ncbi:transcriptional regulator [Pseudomonas tussilaginis]|uniref:transcriptional regulator n=1 Tax=Pseudomonas putida TaxID=303 RepID=UPI0023637638|nr:transcriptional regulator [Pseudomonas putida]MDD1975433.1 transcriptional regulator [Pseudomonas putida]